MEYHNIKLLVKSFLESDKKAREDDVYLFQKVCERYAIVKGMNPEEISQATKYLEVLPLYSTVLRARQDLQANFPELQTDNPIVLERRRRYQLIMEEYFLQCAFPGFEPSPFPPNDVE